MSNSIFGNKLNLGLNGLTKKVAGTSETKEVKAKGAAAAGYASDALVRTGGAQSPASNVPDAARAAELRLAAAYHPDPAVFARNIARSSLEELVSQIG